ncbi:MAG: dTMP kinase [Acidobacteriaceae bacterium]|nr:dTMP kinase [Acidobacteriaceae bacterium]
MTDRGLFISFEGTEGSGKSTQMRLLIERLRKTGHSVIENQEPGGTRIGTEIRRILLDPVNAQMASTTELLLMFASRAQAAEEVVLPALSRGDIVLTDRWTDSTLAYQGEARGLGFDRVLATQRLAIGDLLPHLTLCLEVNVEAGLSRARERNRKLSTGTSEGRMDAQSLEFHMRVQQGYRKIAASEPDRFRIIDGSGEPNEVAERIWQTVARLLRHVSRAAS